MVRYLLAAALVVFMVGCTPDCPECPECPEPMECDSCCVECPECPSCPECPEILECPANYTLVKSELQWECVPPPVGPQPGDYVALEDVPAILRKLADSRPNIGYFACAFANWRDPAYVAVHCSWACGEIFDYSPAEMVVFSMEGQLLVEEMQSLVADLPKANRRCANGNEDFCSVSKVRKARLEAYKAAVRPHNFKASEWRDIAQRDPIRATCAYDSIRGWCECRNAEGSNVYIP